MALADLLARLERRADTPDTPCNPSEVSAKPASIGACTLDIPDTPQGCNSRSVAPRVAPAHTATASRSGQLCDNDHGQAALRDADNDAANPTPTEERIGRMLGRLGVNPDLRYAMESHEHVEPEAVILTVAIRDKGACEVRIPKSRYDAFALLELFDKHTMRETLQ